MNCSGSKNSLCSDETCEVCFSKSFASSCRAKQWDPNNTISPREAFLSSSKKFSFICDSCGHLFTSVLHNLKKGKWCPYCSLPPKKLCQTESCVACFDKSFASHYRAKYWSKLNTCKARQVFLVSNVKYLFDCDKCGHCFDISLAVLAADRWCRYCSNQDRCANEECQHCFNNSFASSPYAKYWSSSNEPTPRHVAICSGKKYWFCCKICQHEFQMSPSQIGRGAWCPYCANQRLCNNKDCSVCFQKSFSSQPRSKYWSTKNIKTPREVASYSNLKYWFDCEVCSNEFQTMICNVTIADTWCPSCKNKTEMKLFDWLQLKYPLYTISKPGMQRFSWCKNIKTNKYLPFDFYIEEISTIIELDGPQHFKQISNWTPPEETSQRDRLKEYLSIKNGISVIRLLQTDVCKNKNNWESSLSDAIEYSTLQDDAKILWLYEENIIQEITHKGIIIFETRI